mgnify:CR=1 FL=1
MNRSLLPACTLLFACSAALAALPARAEQAIDQKVAADPHGAVEISNSVGSIHCTGWDRPEIQISGEMASSAARLDVQQQGATTYIRVLTRNGGMTGTGETDLEIKMPAGSSLRVSAVSADVEVRGITGDQRLQSVSGDVQTEAAKADVALKSISGNVKVHGKAAPIHTSLSTVSGDVSVLDVAGELELDTVSGDVTIDMASLTRARLKTISGDVLMTARLSPDVRIDGSSVSGNLRLRWPGAEGAAIEMESFSGDISSCFGGTPVQRPTYGPGSSWRHSPAGAKGDIHLKSMSGDINLCNR